MKINGIVLAAGYGSRLAPLTLQIPKPALQLCGEPLIVKILRRMRDAGVEKIAVNTHHLKEKVEKAVLESDCADRVELYYEEEILGTAGPLVNAKELLTDCDCFVLHNADVACDFDLKRMIAEHAASGASLTMALVDGPENRVHVENGRVVDILDRLEVPYTPCAEKLTYACVSVFSPDFFDCLPTEVRPTSFADAWFRALRAGKKINVFRPGKGYFWSDIGSFAQYFDAHKRIMLDGEAPELGPKQSLIVGKNCKIDPSAVFSGFVAMGNDCVVPAGAHLHNCILLNGAKVRSGYSAFEVFSKTFSCHMRQKELLKLKIFEKDSRDLNFISLPEQGSDRKFYRVVNSYNESRILMISNAADRDFDRFVTLGAFFSKYHMRTPEIYRSCKEEYTVLMEDLGDGTLYRLFHGKSDEETFDAYSSTLRALTDFQSKGANAIGNEDLEYRLFTGKLLRWESSYFMENFLAGICGFGFTPEESAELQKEYDLIASAAAKMPYVPIHRDFQSQNILLCGGEIRFVDFQGSRMGPYTYDAASLIKDPYMNLSKPLRDRLYRVYYEALKESGFDVPEEEFERDCVVGALQRNMQALGAYGFLSLKKGKKRYLNYAEPCLQLLLDGLEQSASVKLELPRLTAIARLAEGVLPRRLNTLKEN